MDVPENLDAWTFDTVQTVVTKHEFEPGRFEFKEALRPTKGTPEWKAEHTASLRRTVCSMANGYGGFIIFGVLDRSVPVPTPKERIVGIPRSSDLRKEFGDKLKPIQPEAYFETKAIEIPGNETKCVFVARIPTSTKRPHMFEDRFYIRGEGGSARPMGVDEVRDQMLYTEGRLQKVRLLRMELASILGVCQMLDHPGTWSVRFDTSAFKVLLADICDLLQPDSGLLGILQSIGGDAATLNQLLDRDEELRALAPEFLTQATRRQQDEIVALRQDLPNRQADLFNRCGKAQERLAALFGPLSI